MNAADLKALRLHPQSAALAVLDIAPLSDTGNAVPVAIKLQAPTGLSIASFALYAPENPEPRLIEVFTGAVNRYSFETRIRLGASQDIWLIAKLSDGALLGVHEPTVLTSSACFDAS